MSPANFLRQHPSLALAGAAFLLRGALLGVLFFRCGETFAHFLSISDAGGYLAVAKAVFGLAPGDTVSLYDSRLSPGWPVAFGGLLWAGLPDGIMVVVTLGLAAAVPVLFHRLTGALSLSWYLVYFTPAWLIASTHPMSESLYLFAVLASLVALKRLRFAPAGALAGAAVTIRPFGLAWCAALVAAAVRTTAARKARLGVLLGLAAIPVAAMLALNQRLYGDAFRQLHVYEMPLSKLNLAPDAAQQLGAPASHRGWPLQHVLLTPWRTNVPLWKTVYVYAHVAILLVLAGRAAIELRDRTQADWQRALTTGFLLNGALVVCGGPYWGFHSFDHYFVWGLPGALWVARDWLSSRAWLHWMMAPLSIAVASYGLLRHS